MPSASSPISTAGSPVSRIRDRRLSVLLNLFRLQTVRGVDLLGRERERRRTFNDESMSFPPVPDTGARQPGQGFVVGPDDGDAYWWLGSLTLTKLRGADTHHGVDIVDHRVPAGYARLRTCIASKTRCSTSSADSSTCDVVNRVGRPDRVTWSSFLAKCPTALWSPVMAPAAPC